LSLAQPFDMHFNFPSGGAMSALFTRSLAGLALIAAFAATPALAEDLKLTGPAGQSETLTAAQFAALPHVSLTVTIEGKTMVFQGVPLTALLARVGAPQGETLRGKALADVVLVAARDGYIVALALADTDAKMRKDQVILADRMNGAPLPDTAAPYRLVVEGDLRAARTARMVTSISARNLA
jgi:DMSO/TMAO reductase YedYZ molybdopterin-dependent catalytic subunit